jgi:hypothetical protein
VTLGGSVKGAYHPNTEEDKSKTTIIGQNGELTHNNTTVNQGLVRNNYLCNAYAKYKPAKEQEIIVDADYLYRKQHGDQLVTSYNYDMNLQSLPGQNLRDDKLSIIQVTVGKADYNVKLSDDCKLEAGIKCSYASADKNEYFETGNNGAWAYDTIRSSHFVYKENINAVYASVNKSFGKKWETQAGLRVENTGSNGNQITQGKEFDNNYTSFFPTAFVSYKVDDKNSVELSCGRRIERPAYTMMDPFITFFSQYYYHAGNPNLLPAYRMYVDLNHNYNNTLFTSVGCGKVNGVITPVLQYTGTTNSIFATWGNYADRFVANASVNFNKQVNKWWLLETYGAAYYNRFYGYKSNRYLAESIGYSIHMHHQFTLKHGWGVDTTIYYNSGDLQNLVDRYGPNYWLGFNVSKKIMKDSATIRLSVEDPFRTYNPNSVSNWNGIETASSLRFNSQSVGLGFTYNFGKKIEGAQQRQANTEEAGRM